MRLEGVVAQYAERGLRPWLEQEVAPGLARWEVICQCGICFRCTLSPEAKALWCDLRGRWGRPLAVVSGLRCPAHQRAVNPSVPNSLHCDGEALDIAWPTEGDREEFLQLAQEVVGEGGLGVYRWGIHIDTGKGRARNRRWTTPIQRITLIPPPPSPIKGEGGDKRAFPKGKGEKSPRPLGDGRGD